MPQTITVGYKALCEAAEREIETLPVDQAVLLAGRDDVVLVDIRDIRELQREGRVPGAFHCPRGMLEFMDRPTKPVSQAGLRGGQEIRIFLRRGPAFGACGPDGAADGPEVSVAHVQGGFGAWKKAGGPVEAPDPASAETKKA